MKSAADYILQKTVITQFYHPVQSYSLQLSLLSCINMKPGPSIKGKNKERVPENKAELEDTKNKRTGKSYKKTAL